MNNNKIQMNVFIEPEVKAKIEALGRLTRRGNNADVVAWLVDEKYAELIGTDAPVQVVDGNE